jgi:hypothetical protein
MQTKTVVWSKKNRDRKYNIWLPFFIIISTSYIDSQVVVERELEEER